VGRQAVPALLALDVTDLGLLVQQMQALVARVEVDAVGLMNGMAADGLEKMQ